jgi:hypothetical protein
MCACFSSKTRANNLRANDPTSNPNYQNAYSIGVESPGSAASDNMEGGVGNKDKEGTHNAVIAANSGLGRQSGTCTGGTTIGNSSSTNATLLEIERQQVLQDRMKNGNTGANINASGSTNNAGGNGNHNSGIDQNSNTVGIDKNLSLASGCISKNASHGHLSSTSSRPSCSTAARTSSNLRRIGARSIQM